MKIRPAIQDDLAQIIKIYSTDPIVGGHEIISEEVDVSYKRTFKLMNEDDNQLLLVAEDSGIIQGTLQANCIQYLISRSWKVAIVEAIFVHPDHVNKGIGTLLIKEAEGWAKRKNCGTLKLTTNRKRTEAHRFYEKLGFNQDHIAFKKKIER